MTATDLIRIALSRDVELTTGPFVIAFRRYQVGCRSVRVTTLSQMSAEGERPMVALPSQLKIAFAEMIRTVKVAK